MRIIAHENVAATVICELRDRGHDVLSVREMMRAEKDPSILSRAQADERVVLTHDKDFGELAFRSGLPARCGVILLRLSGATRDADNRRVIEALESHSNWEGHFSVVEQDRIRVRPLPASTPNDIDSES